VLERKIEELSRLLADERQKSRKHKLAVSRLQRDLSKAKPCPTPVVSLLYWPNLSHKNYHDDGD